MSDLIPPILRKSTGEEVFDAPLEREEIVFNDDDVIRADDTPVEDLGPIEYATSRRPRMKKKSSSAVTKARKKGKAAKIARRANRK